MARDCVKNTWSVPTKSDEVQSALLSAEAQSCGSHIKPLLSHRLWRLLVSKTLIQVSFTGKTALPPKSTENVHNKRHTAKLIFHLNSTHPLIISLFLSLFPSVL